MKFEACRTPDAAERAAALSAAELLRAAIAERGGARLVAATGSSQIGVLERLCTAPDIQWAAVELFHLDEYVGIRVDHPASFQRFLIDRLILPTGITNAHLIDGLGDPDEVIARVGRALESRPVDVLLAGIGENGHLAFNEPPADFDRTDPYFVVELDEVSRGQQVREGWFADVTEVPRTAITMSIRQILAAREIVCVVTGLRKASAVHACFTGEVRPLAPASILRTHQRATVYLDDAAGSRLPAAGSP